MASRRLMDNNHQATQSFSSAERSICSSIIQKANATSPRGAIKKREIVKLPADLAKHFLMAIDDTVTVAFNIIHILEPVIPTLQQFYDLKAGSRFRRGAQRVYAHDILRLIPDIYVRGLILAPMPSSRLCPVKPT